MMAGKMFKKGWLILNAGVTAYDAWVNLFCPCLLCAVWYAHLFHGVLPCIHPGLVSVLIVDSYIFFVILLAALRRPKFIPQRQVALISIPALFLVLVMSFAEMYVQNTHVSRELAYNRSFPYGGNWNAAYFSLVTITTVGYGDYTPKEGDARMLVMGELLSGALLLFFAFPVLGSRLAMFDEPEGTTTVRYLPEGTWEVREQNGGKVSYYKGERVVVTVPVKGKTEVTGAEKI